MLVGVVWWVVWKDWCVPFLCAADDVVLAIGGLFGSGGNVGNITTGSRLGNGNARALLSSQEIRKKSLLELFAAVLDDGWNSEGKSGCERSTRTRETRTSKLMN